MPHEPCVPNIDEHQQPGTGGLHRPRGTTNLPEPFAPTGPTGYEDVMCAPTADPELALGPSTGMSGALDGPLHEGVGDAASIARFALNAGKTTTHLMEALGASSDYDLRWLMGAGDAPLRLMGHVFGDDPFAASTGGHLLSAGTRTATDLGMSAALRPFLGAHNPLAVSGTGLMSAADSFVDVDNPLKFATNFARSVDPRANARGMAYSAIDAGTAMWNMVTGEEEIAEQQLMEHNARALQGNYGGIVQGVSIASNMVFDPDGTSELLTDDAAAQGERGYNVAWGNCVGDMWYEALSGDYAEDDIATITPDETDRVMEDPRYLERVRLANMHAEPGRLQQQDIAELAGNDEQIAALNELIALQTQYSERGAAELRAQYGPDLADAMLPHMDPDALEDMGQNALFQETIRTETQRRLAEGQQLSMSDSMAITGAALARYPEREVVQDRREDEQDTLQDRIDDARDWIEDERGYEIDR